MMNLNYLHSTHKKFLIVSMLLMAILVTCIPVYATPDTYDMQIDFDFSNDFQGNEIDHTVEDYLCNTFRIQNSKSEFLLAELDDMNQYHIVGSTSGTTSATLFCSNKNVPGQIIVQGLKVGRYTLVQQDSTEGYQRLPDVSIDISANSVTINGFELELSEDERIPLNIIFVPDFPDPLKGSAIPYSLIGGVMAVSILLICFWFHLLDKIKFKVSKKKNLQK